MRAWTIPRGTPCVKAAGKIHTDMEKGFIRAEVINIDDFIACGSEHAAREKGMLRLEGKNISCRMATYSTSALTSDPDFKFKPEPIPGLIHRSNILSNLDGILK